MKFSLLLYETPSVFAARGTDLGGDYMGAWHAYFGALKEAGVLAGGEALEPPKTGTTLRLQDGKRHVQDGPFADTKEQLGGLILIDVPTLDEALNWAARCPNAVDGAVEVRPIWEMADATSSPCAA